MNQFIVVILISLAFTKATPVSPQQQQQQQQLLDKQSKQQQKHQQIKQIDQTAASTNFMPEKDNQFSATSIIENPSYDPNLYSSFIPQDAIQQYVNQFGAPFSSYGSNGFSAPAPFAVQTGYEGFLVPDVQHEPLYSGPLTFVKGIVPKVVVAWLIKSAAMILSTLGVVLFGGIITTAVCTLTPLCSITFNALPSFKWRETAEAVGKAIGTEITPERIRRTVEFVSAAIDKYNALQDNPKQHVRESYAGTEQ